MGSSVTKGKPSRVFQGKKGVSFSRNSKCGNGEHLYFICLGYIYIETASTVIHIEESPMAMLVDS